MKKAYLILSTITLSFFIIIANAQNKFEVGLSIIEQFNSRFNHPYYVLPRIKVTREALNIANHIDIRIGLSFHYRQQIIECLASNSTLSGPSLQGFYRAPELCQYHGRLRYFEISLPVDVIVSFVSVERTGIRIRVSNNMYLAELEQRKYSAQDPMLTDLQWSLNSYFRNLFRGEIALGYKFKGENITYFPEIYVTKIPYSSYERIGLSLSVSI